MDFKELDEYIAKYGFDNDTDIDNMPVAMRVNKIRQDIENILNEI